MPSLSNRAWLSSRSNSARDEMATISGGRRLDGMRAVCATPVAGGEKRHAGAAGPSGHELLAEDAFLEVVLGIEQQGDGAVARLLARAFEHVADFVRVGGGADRALVWSQHPESHHGVGPEQGAAPASRAEG